MESAWRVGTVRWSLLLLPPLSLVARPVYPGPRVGRGAPSARRTEDFGTGRSVGAYRLGTVFRGNYRVIRRILM